MTAEDLINQLYELIERGSLSTNGTICVKIGEHIYNDFMLSQDTNSGINDINIVSEDLHALFDQLYEEIEELKEEIKELELISQSKNED